MMWILNVLTGLPTAILQPAKRAFGAHEAEWARLHLQSERHADFLWAQCNRCSGLRHPGGDEEPSMWRSRCGGVQPHPGDSVEQECHHLQVSMWSLMMLSRFLLVKYSRSLYE